MIAIDEACSELRAGRAVPLARRLPADLLTPLGALARLLGGAGALGGEPPAGGPAAFLFESVERGERIGRYSYVGVAAEPWRAVGAADFRASLREAAAIAPAAAARAGLPRFFGGAVFQLDWDYVRDLEPRLGAPPEVIARVALFRDVLAFDHLRQEVFLVHTLFPGGDPEASYERGARRLEDLARRLDEPLPGVGAGKGRSSERLAATPSLDCAEYAARAARAKEYIAAGDIFQVVLSRRFERRARASGLAIYRALRMVNPSPYMFYLRIGAREVAGASPELLVRVEGGEAMTHPIAGTRPRGRDESEDLRLERDLLSDPKERAEHAMLVDLARNDLGRLAERGGVRVARHMEVERFSHVMHLVSEVRARLRPGVDAVCALDACFPAGTLSGAPKVRAIEIIDELEPEPRGAYGGAVGALAFGGALDACIAIRFVERERGLARFQAGAGIVSDSVPEREADETRAKALAMLRAIERAEEGLL